LVRERPTVIGVQNPSLILALLATTYGQVTRTPVVVDAHNAGLSPPGGRCHRILLWIAQRVIARASLTIVTNTNLTDGVRRQGGRPFVLSTAVPDLRHLSVSPALQGRRNVLFICSYADDEPYVEVIRAAQDLDPETAIYITGRPKQDAEELRYLAGKNVVLTGFLPETDFISLLHAVDVVIDLTTRENCLLQGAYEAVAAEKPMVLSGTAALRVHFNKGACFTNNTADDVARQINDALSRRATLVEEVKILKREQLAEGMRQKAELSDLMRRLSRGECVEPHLRM
jgi:hypothetical protein